MTAEIDRFMQRCQRYALLFRRAADLCKGQRSFTTILCDLIQELRDRGVFSEDDSVNMRKAFFNAYSDDDFKGGPDFDYDVSSRRTFIRAAESLERCLN